jgi:hypothetical protein
MSGIRKPGPGKGQTGGDFWAMLRAIDPFPNGGGYAKAPPRASRFESPQLHHDLTFDITCIFYLTEWPRNRLCEARRKCLRYKPRERRKNSTTAMKKVGNADRQEVGGRLNNRAENSLQPFRRRERGILRFRSMKTLRSSAQFTARSTTTSIRNAISSPPSVEAETLCHICRVARSRGLNAA